jgi:spore coat protein U-like protein
MSFNINPAGLGTLTPATTDAGNTSPSVKCTKNAAHAVACSSVHANTLTIGNDGVTDPIAYTITGCPASLTGSGFSTATPIPVGISILQTAYQDARVGAHSDTITITVTY